MNRIFLTVLIVAIYSARLVGQDPDTLSPQPAPDTLSQQNRADTLSPTRYQDFIESDTLYDIYGTDTITRYRSGVRVEAGSALVVDDTALVEDDRVHSPTKAVMFALVLPGLGQGYNRKFYKIPIVFAAVGGAGYAISYTSKQYKFYSKEYANNPDDLGERYLRYWRRNMELSYIAMIAVYALQVVDAYVDAQLYSWDVNEELSMGISPSVQPLLVPGSLTGHSYGLTCSFKLKK